MKSKGMAPYVLMVVLVAASAVVFGFTLAWTADSPNRWGGPYTPKTFVGKDPPNVEELAIQWEDSDRVLEIRSSDTDYGYTYSIEIREGRYQISGDCIFYPDYQKNGLGDLNPRLEDSIVTFEEDGWGAVVVLPDNATDCQFGRLE